MQTVSVRRATLSAFPLLVASAATLAVLATMRPHLAGSPASWRGDDLAFATTWVVAVACAAWLTLTTTAWLAAMAGGCFTFAARVADWAPPIAGRILQAALVTTWAVAPTAAHATPTSSAAPVIVQVGPNGRLASVPQQVTLNDTPVVRAPRPTVITPPPVPSTTAPPPPTTTTSRPVPVTTLVAPIPVAPTVRVPATPHPTASPSPAVAEAPSVEASRTAHSYVVRAGDDLWRIAEHEVARASGVADPDDGAIAEYWERVIAANRSTLRSGDPSLIYPGEVLRLP